MKPSIETWIALWYFFEFALMLLNWQLGASIWIGRLIASGAFVMLLTSIYRDFRMERIRRATERHHQQLRDEFIQAMRELRRNDRIKGDDT